MIRTTNPRRPIPALAGLVLLAGCGSGTEPGPAAQPQSSAAAKAKAKTAHDPDDVPITEADVERPEGYDDAVARIKSYRGSIRDDIAAGRPTKAHRALDELDIVLDWLPGIARDGGVPKEHWEAVNTAAQALREQFNKVHAQIDAGEAPDYDAVAGAVDEAIARLESVEADDAAPAADSGP